MKIPVIANGGITTPEKAKFVLDKTGADSIMMVAPPRPPWLLPRNRALPENRQSCRRHRRRDPRHPDGASRRPVRLYGVEPRSRRPQARLLVAEGLIGSAAFRKVMNTLPTLEERADCRGQLLPALCGRTRAPAIRRRQNTRGRRGSMSQHDLGKCVVTALEQYFRDLDEALPPSSMVLRSVRTPRCWKSCWPATPSQTLAAEMLASTAIRCARTGRHQLL